MKKITAIFLSLVLCLLLPLGTVGISASGLSAAVTDNQGSEIVGSISASQKVFVTGTATPGELVMLNVLRPMADGTELSESNLTSYLYWADDTFAKKDGSFTFSLSFTDEPTGDYIIRISSVSGEKEAFVLSVINEADKVKALDAINGAADADDIAELFILSDGAKTLSLTTKAYSRLNTTGSDINLVFDAIFAREDYKPLTFGNISEFNVNIFEPYSALALFNQEQSGDILDEFSNIFDLLSDSAAAETYKLIPDENKADAADIILGNKFDSIEDMQKEYHIAIVLEAVRSSAWQNFDKAISLNYKLFDDISYDEYNALDSKSDVALELNGKSFTDAKSFVEAFNDAVDAASGNEGGSPNTGSSKPSKPSSGGSSVGVSGGSFGELPDFVDKSFKDLADYEWAKSAIEYLQDKNIISGTAENIFSPSDTVKREEFVKMLVLIMGKYNANASADFADVPSGHWSESYIASAVEAGLVQGIDSESFGLGYEISREDACVLLYRALAEKTSENSPKEFTDADEISDYAKEAVDLMSALGIISGMDDGSFKPADAMTRAQAAKLLYEFCQVIGG